MSDTALWNGIRNGVSTAYRQLYDEYIDQLYAYGKRFLKQEDLLNDCLMDLFSDLYQYRSSLSETVNIKAYLMSSLRRKIAVATRKQQPFTALASDDILSNAFKISFEPDAEQLLILAEEEQDLFRKVMEELNTLPARQKEALYLRYACDMEYDDIATLMNVSVPTVRTLVYRSVKELRERFDKVALSLLLAQYFHSL